MDFLKLCASDRGERRRICFYLVATDSSRLAAYTKHTLRTSSFCCYHYGFLSCSKIKVFQTCEEKGQIYFFNALDAPFTLLHHPFPFIFRCWWIILVWISILLFEQFGASGIANSFHIAFRQKNQAWRVENCKRTSATKGLTWQLYWRRYLFWQTISLLKIYH